MNLGEGADGDDGDDGDDDLEGNGDDGDDDLEGKVRTVGTETTGRD